MTEIVSPSGQAIISDGHGHGYGHGDKAFEAALISQGSAQRETLHTSLLARLDGQDTARNAALVVENRAVSNTHFGELKAMILAEAEKTRHCLLQQEIDRLRSDKLRLEIVSRTP